MSAAKQSFNSSPGAAAADAVSEVGGEPELCPAGACGLTAKVAKASCFPSTRRVTTHPVTAAPSAITFKSNVAPARDGPDRRAVCPLRLPVPRVDGAQTRQGAPQH